MFLKEYANLSFVNGGMQMMYKESDTFIVVKKPMKVGGAKGCTNKRFLE